jgi:hypothetical protein
MEVDRIQPVKGLKVERAGSEQERRRQQQDVEEFHELLDESLDDGDQRETADDEHAGDDRTPAATDTVSITNGDTAGPLVQDFVSISVQARMSALDPEKAEQPAASRYSRSHGGEPVPRIAAPQSNAGDDEQAQGQDEDDPAGIDTVA